MSTEDEGFDYDGYLLYNEICEVHDVTDQEFEGTPRSVENHLLEEYLPEFEEGDSRDEGEGFELSDIRSYTSDLPNSTQEFINSLVSLRHRKEDYETEEAEISPDKPRQDVKIPNEQAVHIFWKSPDKLLVRGPDGAADHAKDEFNTWIGQSAQVHSIGLPNDFLLWMFKKIYYDEDLTDKLKLGKLTDAKVEGAEDVLGKENTVKESSNAKEAPTLLIGLLLGKSLTMMEGNFVLKISDEGETKEKSIRIQIERDKIQIKSSKAGMNNASKIEKMGYATESAYEIMELYEEWQEIRDDDSTQEHIVPPTFLEALLIKSHENDIPIEDRSTILSVLRQYANRRGDSLTDDYNIDEGLDLLDPDNDDNEDSD
ncbi:hypothetical protein [Halorubrum tebenquichense]|nr:hypothetical protein [Halorubrum tebenquichense]